MNNTGPLVTTFSIIAYDPAGPAWGIAIASRFLAVGAQTCWGEPGVGAVVLQAYLNARNGPAGIELLKQGLSASEVIEQLMAQDSRAELRQMAVVDANGQVATYTGDGCMEWAGGVTGEHSAAQGNMLLGGRGCAAMVEHFESSTDSFPRRLVDALAMGDQVAGDSRGRQAAALYVIRPDVDERIDVYTEPIIDLRVDDHPDPHAELSRLLDLYELIYFPTASDEKLPVNELTVRRFQRALARLGYYSGALTGDLDAPTRGALQNLARMENYRVRIAEGEWLDGRLLHHLETNAGVH